MYDFSHISMRSLSIFVEVYDVQNFSIVARREGISASQVSRIIHQLEDAIGQPLFYRNTRAIMPTESGHIFIRHVRAMVGNLDAARRELGDRELEPSGLIRINAPVFFGQKHVAPELAGLTECYPRLTIDLTLTDDYIDPHKDAADVIFRIGELTDSSFHARIFGQQYYRLAASPGYLQKYGVPESPTDLSQHKCLVYCGSSGPNRWLFRGKGEAWVHYPVSALMSSNHAESLLIAAMGGMGIVLFPDWLISEKLQSGELIALMLAWEASIKSEPLTIAAIYPHARHPTLNVRAVIDYYVEAFGSPLKWQLNDVNAG